ncbi:MAG: alpha/beta fold hydrolase [Hyphomicrobiaceae bacterium]
MTFEWDVPSSNDRAVSRIALPDGGCVECATWGPPPAQAPTIILLHEGLGCIRLWRDFPGELAAATGCGVFAYSRLGYGQSDPITPPLPVTRMADEAHDVLPALIEMIAPQALILVGHSDGGTIAAHALAGETHPALRAAVLMSPHFFCEASNVATIKDTCAAYRDGDLRARLAKYHADVDGAFYGWADTWLDPDFAIWDMRDEIARWRHPVLFVQGRDDPYGSERQGAAAAMSPHAEIVWLEDCAHSPHLEQGARTLALLRTFIAKAVSDDR